MAPELSSVFPIYRSSAITIDIVKMFGRRDASSISHDEMFNLDAFARRMLIDAMPMPAMAVKWRVADKYSFQWPT